MGWELGQSRLESHRTKGWGSLHVCRLAGLGREEGARIWVCREGWAAESLLSWEGVLHAWAMGSHGKD